MYFVKLIYALSEIGCFTDEFVQFHAQYIW